MRRLSLKWKFYYWLNVFIVVSLLILVGLSINNLIMQRFQLDINEIFMRILYWSGEVTLIVNNLLNLQILIKYFPDKMLSQKIDMFSTYLFFVCIIVLMMLIPKLVLGILEFEKLENFPRKNFYLYLMYFYGSTLFLQVFILIFQIRLPGIISRNNHKSMNSIVESIGKE